MTKTRSQQKEETRRAIINAAIGELNDDKSFASLSLREVTRKAGIAPNSFYRHFKDMEELGLILVDESGLAIRQIMRKARKRFKENGSIIVTSVKTFFEYIETNANILRLLFHERSGTTRALRVAVKREIQFFIVELTDYLISKGYEEDIAFMQSEAMVAIIFNAGAESLAAKPAQIKEIKLRAIQQLRLIAVGARVTYLD